MVISLFGTHTLLELIHGPMKVMHPKLIEKHPFLNVCVGAAANPAATVELRTFCMGWRGKKGDAILSARHN